MVVVQRNRLGAHKTLSKFSAQLLDSLFRVVMRNILVNNEALVISLKGRSLIKMGMFAVSILFETNVGIQENYFAAPNHI